MGTSKGNYYGYGGPCATTQQSVNSRSVHTENRRRLCARARDLFSILTTKRRTYFTDETARSNQRETCTGGAQPNWLTTNKPTIITLQEYEDVRYCERSLDHQNPLSTDTRTCTPLPPFPADTHHFSMLDKIFYTKYLDVESTNICYEIFRSRFKWNWCSIHSQVFITIQLPLWPNKCRSENYIIQFNLRVGKLL